MQKIIEEKIKKIKEDIESIKIQGATNVALATLDAMNLVANDMSDNLLYDLEKVGFELSNARVNEPLARNAVRFVLTHIKSKNSSVMKKDVQEAIEEFKKLLHIAKYRMKKTAVGVLKDFNIVMTHCHSTTTETALIELSKMKSDFKVVTTETRPLFQGRITAKHLLDNGVDVYMIVDSAASSFIVQDQYLTVDRILVGCDELLQNGSIVNKVGTFSLALSSHSVGDKLYVMTTLLKMDLDRITNAPKIEIRPAREIWEDAPVGLKLINPAFELVPSDLIAGYITEAGLLTKEQLIKKAKSLYNWL